MSNSQLTHRLKPPANDELEPKSTAPQPLRRQDTARTIKVKKQMEQSPYLAALDKLPKFLREGPWSPLAYVYLVGMVVFIFRHRVAITNAYNENVLPSSTTMYPSTTSPDVAFWNFGWRCAMFLYGLGIMTFLGMAVGAWPFCSFTLMSWNLFVWRYLITGLTWLQLSQYGSGDIHRFYLFEIGEFLRYPALWCNSITVSIWWGILVPGILFFMDSPNARKAFMEFNRSFMLINLHFLNLPFAALDHYLGNRTLCQFDMAAAFSIGFFYIMVYLFIMDPLGLHFYHILLSPRPHWCVLNYTFVIALLPVYMRGWNLFSVSFS